MSKTAAKTKRGRPQVEMPPAQAEAFGRCKATYETMADFWGVTTETIRVRMKTDPAFSGAYKKGLANMKQTLSEKQLDIALAGNPTMLIWLGKQHLGQTDKQDVDVDDKRTQKKLVEMTDEELQFMIRN